MQPQTGQKHASCPGEGEGGGSGVHGRIADVVVEPPMVQPPMVQPVSLIELSDRHSIVPPSVIKGPCVFMGAPVQRGLLKPLQVPMMIRSQQLSVLKSSVAVAYSNVSARMVHCPLLA